MNDELKYNDEQWQRHLLMKMHPALQKKIQKMPIFFINHCALIDYVQWLKRLKDTVQKWNQFRIKKKNHILYEPLTLSIKSLLPLLLMWTRNHRNPLLQHQRRVTAENQRGLNSQYCAIIVTKKSIFIPIAHTCQRTMPIKYRLLRYQTLTLLLNIQKTWKNLNNLKHQRAVT